MRNFNSLSVAIIVALSSITAHAQNSVTKDPLAASSQIVHLSASASAQVTQDWLVMTLAVQKDGTDAATVQKQIKTQLASALSLAPLQSAGTVTLDTQGALTTDSITTSGGTNTIATDSGNNTVVLNDGTNSVTGPEG